MANERLGRRVGIGETSGWIVRWTGEWMDRPTGRWVDR